MGNTNPPHHVCNDELLKKACEVSFFARNILDAFEKSHPTASAEERKSITDLACIIAGV